MTDTPLTLAEAAQLGAAVWTAWGVSIDQINAWEMGTADGGPNGDGRYPFTNRAGTTVLSLCPAALEEIGGNLTAMLAALPTATTNDSTVDPTHYVAPAQVTLPVIPHTGGAPVMATPYLFLPRRTVDLNVLPGSEYAEWISCISSTGLERKLAVSALQRAVGNVIDPTLPPYNVKYDFKKAKFVSATAGSNIITAYDPSFDQNDLGKLVNLSNAGTNGSSGAMIGYVGQVQSNKVIAIFTDLTFSTPANATNTQGYAEMICGTDCTAGLQQAFDDAEPVGNPLYNLGKVVIIGGIACARHLEFGSISIVGLAKTSCGFAVLAVPDGNPWAHQGFMQDKQTGATYGGTYKPQSYTLKDFKIFGQRFTQNYGSFRRNMEVRGGTFDNFVTGAPYSVVDGLEFVEASWDGAYFNGAFGGQFTNVSAYQNAQCGLRMGYWDLNGSNWHCEGNGCAGVMSTMPGANVNVVRCSFNGANALAYVAGGTWPIQHGANWCEMGYGNIVTNLRMQESWSNSLVFSSVDPLGIGNNNGQKAKFSAITFDDTGDIWPADGQGNTPLPPVRAMVYFHGNTCNNNIVDGAGSGQVKQVNYATNGYYDDGNPSGNDVTLKTPGITNDLSSWYAGGSNSGDTAAASRGPTATGSSSSIATRGNTVVVNGQAAA